MTCFHPLKAFQVGYTANGKKNLVVTSYDIDYVIHNKKDETTERCKGYPLKKDLLNPQLLVVTDFIEIPCGQCLGCRLKYAKDWSVRCMLEASQYTHNYFVTLTYDNDHVPVSKYLNPETGVYTETFTLNDRDLQLFFKRLRRRLDYNGYESFRYYAAGEYGDTTFRPHYHFIGFNLNIPDLQFFQKSPNGDNFYISKFLSDCWQKGHVIIGECTPETCQYVARYVVKKQKGDSAHVYFDVNIQPPFVRCSRRPGIAHDVVQERLAEFWNDRKVILSTRSGGRSFGLPRYISQNFEVAYPYDYEAYKLELAEIAKDLKELKMQNTDVSYLEMLQAEEDSLKSRYFKKNVRKVG